MTKKHPSGFPTVFSAIAVFAGLAATMDIFVGQDAESLGLPIKVQENKQSRRTFKYEFWFLICPTIS